MTMTNTPVEDRITELNAKLDYIVEEIHHLRRLRNSAEDLVADLSLVGKDAMGEAAAALSAVDLRPQDAIQLLKTVLVDARLLTTALQQLESASDFVQDAQPIVRDLYQQAVTHLQQLEEKGYFNTARSGVRIADALIQAHSAEDLKQVEASIPQLIGFLRELTRPEVLEALESIIHGFGRVQATMNVNKSIFQIVRDLNSPNARRGTAILVEFLKIVGERSSTVAPATSPAATAQEK
jgi:uncharacterized protein YjgD (DUF1641 family)